MIGAIQTELAYSYERLELFKQKFSILMGDYPYSNSSFQYLWAISATRAFDVILYFVHKKRRAHALFFFIHL